jgi:hypothetical protein
MDLNPMHTVASWLGGRASELEPHEHALASELIPIEQVAATAREIGLIRSTPANRQAFWDLKSYNHRDDAKAWHHWRRAATLNDTRRMVRRRGFAFGPPEEFKGEIPKTWWLMAIRRVIHMNRLLRIKLMTPRLNMARISVVLRNSEPVHGDF